MFVHRLVVMSIFMENGNTNADANFTVSFIFILIWKKNIEAPENFVRGPHEHSWSFCAAPNHPPSKKKPANDMYFIHSNFPSPLPTLLKYFWCCFIEGSYAQT